MQRKQNTVVKIASPREGPDTLRLGDGNDLVIIENIRHAPSGAIELERHGIIILVTDGSASFDYDGNHISLQKDDMYLYMKGSVCNNFNTSPDFNARQIWFSESELWTINAFSSENLSDLIMLKQHPKVHLNEYEAKQADDYFKLLCRQMRSPSDIMRKDIVRSLLVTMMLLLLSFMRREFGQSLPTPNNHQIADKFVKLLERSKGRIRTVAYYADELNITAKQLNRIVNETMGRTPSQIIQFYTRKAIEYELRYTDHSIKEVAAYLGFPNESIFGRYVKARLGVTPMAFRKKYRH